MSNSTKSPRPRRGLGQRSPRSWCRRVVAPQALLLLAGGVAAVGVGSLISSGPAEASGGSPTAYVAIGGTVNAGLAVPVDTATNTAGSPIKVSDAPVENPAGPVAVAMSPDAQKAYVDVGGAGIVTVDTASNKAESVASSSSGIATGFAVSPDGETGWVTFSNSGTIEAIDLATGVGRPYITAFDSPDAIAISPDGKTVYVADAYGYDVTPVDAQTGAVGGSIGVGSSPTAMAITPNGSTIYVACGGNDETSQVVPIDTATDTAGTPISDPGGADAITITPNGATAYVANADGTVMPITTSSNTAGTRIDVGTYLTSIAVTPDGKTVYAGDYDNKAVYPITTATNTVGSPVTVSSYQGPTAMAITPDQAPDARLSVSPAPVGESTTFDASASVAGSSPIVSYAWNFGDGNTTTTSSPTVSHTYTSAGAYTATVTETDEAGTSTTQVYTGQSVLRNGGPQAEASSTFEVVECAANSNCAATVSTPQQSVSVSGVSSTPSDLTLSDTDTTLDCGPKYDYDTTVSTLAESDFTSSVGLTVLVTQENEATAKGVKICYQPVEANPPAPTLLKKCSSKVPVPCYSSIDGTGGSVVATFNVPAGDPRFWLGSSALGLKAFSPTSGPPGTTVKITGSALGAVTAVAFGGYQALGTNLQIASNGKSLTVVVPIYAQTGALRVTGDGATYVSKNKYPFTVT